MGSIAPRVSSEIIVTDTIYVSKQTGGTCYAHATATAILEAARRFYQKRMNPEEVVLFQVFFGFLHACLVCRIVGDQGDQGGDEHEALDLIAGDMRNNSDCDVDLKYKVLSEYDVDTVKDYLDNKHVVIASYRLRNDRWTNFNKFFQDFRDDNTWIIDKNDIYKIDNGTHPGLKGKKGGAKGEIGDDGHAVVIVGYGRADPTKHSNYTIYWKIKNSWGPTSPHTYNGYFRAFPDAIGFNRYIPVWCEAK
mmetsp:Transcript_95329/g.116733  ORF Transcript_95329/g.116733 Transcript_95329/m.116733 type:complete len:249 (+) Transcript_95329:66-812(+)